MENIIEHTTLEQRRSLFEIGYVHVTGLTEFKGWRKRVIGFGLKISDVGRWTVQDGISVIVTLGGEIWISASYPENEHKHRELFTMLAPRQQRIEPPPCTNGWHVPTIEVLRRLANPDCEPLPPKTRFKPKKEEPFRIKADRDGGFIT